MAQSYGKIMHWIWLDRTNDCTPKSLRYSVATDGSRFIVRKGHCFMSFLLNSIHKNLKLVIDKPYVEEKADDWKIDDFTLAAEQ